MKQKLIAKAPYWLVLLIALVFAKLQYNKMGETPANACMAICSDGRGYYAWLPAVFIYQDLNFNFFDHVEVASSPCGGEVGGCLQDYRSCKDGIPCNKYYPGTAVLMLPFFGLAHVITTVFTDLPANGYSWIYFACIAIAGVCYYAVGMGIVVRILEWLRLSGKQQMLVIVLLTFGSNAMYYAVDKPSYSHIYSFVEIAAFVYGSLKLSERVTVRRLLFLSFLTGLIFVTRPVNVSIVLVPLLLLRGRLMEVAREVLGRGVYVASLLPVLVMPALLMLAYKVATGSYWVYSYGSEGFSFLSPNFVQYLFDYNNGVLPYTPLVLVALVLVWLVNNAANSKMIVAVVVTMVVTMYIHSAWWCWWYGFSFGARPMLDFLPLVAIAAGLTIRDARLAIRPVVVAVYVLCCVLTMRLYHQKNHGYLNSFPIEDYWHAVTGIASKVG
jgi:hypothetical protein